MVFQKPQQFQNGGEKEVSIKPLLKLNAPNVCGTSDDISPF